MGYDFQNSTTTRLELTGMTPPTPPFTISCWSYIDVTQTQVVIQFGDDSDNGSGWYLVQVANSYNFQENDDAGAAEAATASGTRTEDVWQHVAVRAESTTNRNIRFLETTTTNTNTLSHPTGVDTLRLGAFRETSAAVYTLPYDGALADVCIWDVALTDAEIDLMAVTYLSAGMVRPNDILGWWPLQKDFAAATGTGLWAGTYEPILHADIQGAIREGPPNLIMPSRQEYIVPPVAATDQSKWSMLHYGQIGDFQVPLP